MSIFGKATKGALQLCRAGSSKVYLYQLLGLSKTKISAQTKDLEVRSRSG